MSVSATYLVVSLPQSIRSQQWLEQDLNGGKSPLFYFRMPDFQIGTLDSLVQQSEELSKIDLQLGGSISKVVDILNTVKEGKFVKTVNSYPTVKYVESFQWNASKYRLDKPVPQLVQIISSEAFTLDNDVRAAYQLYQGAKSNFLAANRKKNGDLSIRSLHDIVKPEHFVLNSDHLTTILLAVPKSSVSDFQKSYETLTEFVIPRSAHEIAKDKEYVLYGVTLFKKYVQEFANKARERKWQPRTDFEYSEENLSKMRQEFDITRATESKSKNDLIRLASTAYSDIFSAWFHIKAIRVYVESVLRYGLPPQFDSFLIKFEDSNLKNVGKAKKELIAKYGYLGGEGNSKGSDLHEFSSLLDTEYEPFVLYEVDIA